MNEQEKALASMIAARVLWLIAHAPDAAPLAERLIAFGQAWAFFSRALGMSSQRSRHVMDVANRYAWLLHARAQNRSVAR